MSSHITAKGAHLASFQLRSKSGPHLCCAASPSACLRRQLPFACRQFAGDGTAAISDRMSRAPILLDTGPPAKCSRSRSYVKGFSGVEGGSGGNRGLMALPCPLRLPTGGPAADVPRAGCVSAVRFSQRHPAGAKAPRFTRLDGTTESRALTQNYRRGLRACPDTKLFTTQLRACPDTKPLKERLRACLDTKLSTARLRAWLTQNSRW